MLALVSRGVRELHVREPPSHLVSGVHVTEGGSEDDVAAGTGKTLDGAFGVRALRHAFQICRLDRVAELFLKLQNPLMMLIAPAEVTNRPHIDEAALGLVLPKRSTRKRHVCGCR